MFEKRLTKPEKRLAMIEEQLTKPEERLAMFEKRLAMIEEQLTKPDKGLADVVSTKDTNRSSRQSTNPFHSPQ